MARRQGGSLFFSFFMGVLGASIIWLYFPFLKGFLSGPRPAEAGKAGLNLKDAADLQVKGSRFQMLNDGRQVFLVDLKEGRVWRYSHVIQGSKEQEGFVPMSMTYQGKQYQCASEVGDRDTAQGNELN